MNNLLEVLVQQAFKSQNERIEDLKNENKILKKETETLKQEVDNLKELNTLFDNKVQELLEYIRTYVSKDDENDLMEEYKFGEQDRK